MSRMSTKLGSRNLSPEMKQCEQHVVQESTTTGMEDKSRPEQTGAAGKTRITQRLEDVEEPMPTERYQTNASRRTFVTVSR